MNLEIKVKYKSCMYKLCLATQNAKSSFDFRTRVLIICTIIACGALIRSTVLDYQYDLGVNCKCQIYFRNVIRLVTRTPRLICEGWC